jgi:hypothetical protein
VPSDRPGRFFAAQFSADCTTNMSGFDFRQAQALIEAFNAIRKSAQAQLDLAAAALAYVEICSGMADQARASDRAKRKGGGACSEKPAKLTRAIRPPADVNDRRPYRAIQIVTDRLRRRSTLA